MTDLLLQQVVYVCVVCYTHKSKWVIGVSDIITSNIAYNYIKSIQSTTIDQRHADVRDARNRSESNRNIQIDTDHKSAVHPSIVFVACRVNSETWLCYFGIEKCPSSLIEYERSYRPWNAMQTPSRLGIIFYALKFIIFLLQNNIIIIIYSPFTAAKHIWPNSIQIYLYVSSIIWCYKNNNFSLSLTQKIERKWALWFFIKYCVCVNLYIYYITVWSMLGASHHHQSSIFSFFSLAFLHYTTTRHSSSFNIFVYIFILLMMKWGMGHPIM